MEIITYKGTDYPKIQSEGFASQYSFPLASKFCKGHGLDVGCMKSEWSFPGSFPIDADFPDPWEAMNLPLPQPGNGELWDYVYSSHCAEHLPDYIAAFDYWSTKIRNGGTLFLYLPNMDYQEYWNLANNRKHLHYFNPMIIRSYFNNRKEMWRNVFVTDGYDLNGSFYACSERI